MLLEIVIFLPKTKRFTKIGIFETAPKTQQVSSPCNELKRALSPDHIVPLPRTVGRWCFIAKVGSVIRSNPLKNVNKKWGSDSWFEDALRNQVLRRKSRMIYGHTSTSHAKVKIRFTYVVHDSLVCLLPFFLKIFGKMMPNYGCKTSMPHWPIARLKAQWLRNYGTRCAVQRWCW